MSLTDIATRRRIEPDLGLVIGILAIITIARLVGLTLSDVDLFIDESQYWSWSRELAWGYFSKPPLLAWIIAAAELACGSGEACIRAPAPVFYFCTCIVMYLTARSLYGSIVGLWAALLMMLGVGVVFSARIISTDVPLVFFWALALLAYVKLLERASWPWAVILGVALGLGLLAKYAMIYFMLGMLFAALLDGTANRLLRGWAIWLAVAIAAAIVAPNLVWVLRHDFVTFRSIVGVVQSERGANFNPLPALEFFAAQFAVFGPVVFAVLLYEMAKIRSPEPVAASRIMLAFSIPPLAIITVVALFSHAYANWAATSVVSSTILAAAVLVRRKAWGWLAFSLAIGVVEQGAALYADTVATQVAIPFLPPEKSNIYSRTLGNRALADEVGRFAERVGANTIVGEDRRTVAALLYYRRNAPEQILAWPSAGIPKFDMTRPLTESARQPILLVTGCPFPKRLAAHYTMVEPLGAIQVSTGPTSSRYHAFFKLVGVKGPLTALTRCTR